MTVYSQITANKVKTYLIMAIFIFIFSGFFYLVGKYSNSSGFYFVLGFIISLLSSIGSYFFSDKIVLMTNQAKPANKKEYFDFYTVTENLAIASGLPMPKLYVVDDPAPNAFATGRDPKHAVICVTNGLLEMMDRAELEGVIAHELSHIKNFDILLSSIVAVLVGTLALIADWLMRSFWWGGAGRDRDNNKNNRNPVFFLIFIFVLIITPIVATLIQLAISRRREFLADASGALITRYPEGLARALEKIEKYPGIIRHLSASTAHLFIANPFKKRQISNFISNLFSTHPPVEERIKVLRNI